MKVKCEIQFSLKVGGFLFLILRQASPQKFQSKADLEAAVCIAPVGKQKHVLKQDECSNIRIWGCSNTEPLSCPYDGLNRWVIITLFRDIAMKNRVATGNGLDLTCDKAKLAKC